MPFGLKRAPKIFQRFIDKIVFFLDSYLAIWVIQCSSKLSTLYCLNLSCETLMIPFGLRSAPESFQRFIDKVMLLQLPWCRLGYTMLSKTFNDLLPKPLFIEFHDAIWVKNCSSILSTLHWQNHAFWTPFCHLDWKMLCKLFNHLLTVHPLTHA